MKVTSNKIRMGEVVLHPQHPKLKLGRIAQTAIDRGYAYIENGELKWYQEL